MPALLDEDTLFSGFVAEVLAGCGRSYGERESGWYDKRVKVHEYAGMVANVGGRVGRPAGAPGVGRCRRVGAAPPLHAQVDQLIDRVGGSD